MSTKKVYGKFFRESFKGFLLLVFGFTELFGERPICFESTELTMPTPIGFWMTSQVDIVNIPVKARELSNQGIIGGEGALPIQGFRNRIRTEWEMSQGSFFGPVNNWTKVLNPSVDEFFKVGREIILGGPPNPEARGAYGVIYNRARGTITPVLRNGYLIDGKFDGRLSERFLIGNQTEKVDRGSTYELFYHPALLLPRSVNWDRFTQIRLRKTVRHWSLPNSLNYQDGLVAASNKNGFIVGTLMNPVGAPRLGDPDYRQRFEAFYSSVPYSVAVFWSYTSRRLDIEPRIPNFPSTAPIYDCWPTNQGVEMSSSQIVDSPNQNENGLVQLPHRICEARQIPITVLSSGFTDINDQNTAVGFIQVKYSYYWDASRSPYPKYRVLPFVYNVVTRTSMVLVTNLGRNPMRDVVATGINNNGIIIGQIFRNFNDVKFDLPYPTSCKYSPKICLWWDISIDSALQPAPVIWINYGFHFLRNLVVTGNNDSFYAFEVNDSNQILTGNRVYAEVTNPLTGRSEWFGGRGSALLTPRSCSN
ncbi:MAG: hypothetical protein NZO16_06495 [Deltaproteobacteria bacterium]|nr:hypothetical protein [Deltaproteobacteria bacterium]